MNMTHLSKAYIIIFCVSLYALSFLCIYLCWHLIYSPGVLQYIEKIDRHNPTMALKLLIILGLARFLTGSIGLLTPIMLTIRLVRTKGKL